MSGKQLDIASEPAKPASGAGGRMQPGKFLGVKFECCGVYARVYPNREADAYEGRCPRCLRPIRFDIGPGGTSTRFFSAS